MKKSFIACSLVFAFAKDKKNEINLVQVGKWKGHINGEFKLEKKDLEQIKQNFDNSNINVVIDLDHKTIYEGTGEAYGWINELYINEDTLVGKVEWLEHGKELVKSGKYKYISPVLLPNTIDEVSGENIGWTLHSAALTNRPFFEDLGEILVNNKKDKENQEMTDEEKKALEDENKNLKNQLQDLEVERVEKKVDDAIAANKVDKDQKNSLLAMGKVNPKELTNFLDNAKERKAPFEDDTEMFAASKGDQKIDVLKLGGFENE